MWNNADVTTVTIGRNDLHIAKIYMPERCKLYGRANGGNATARSLRVEFYTDRGNNVIEESRRLRTKEKSNGRYVLKKDRDKLAMKAFQLA